MASSGKSSAKNRLLQDRGQRMIVVASSKRKATSRKSAIASVRCLLGSLLFSIAPAAADPIATSLYGAQDHMSTPGFDPAHTIPLQQQLNGRWVRDGVMVIPRVTVNLPSDSNSSKQYVASIRQQLNSNWSLYDKSGIRVIFTILALAPESGSTYAGYNADFLNMVTQMVHSHPSVYAVELHNEPNVGGAWKGTPEEYVSVYRPFADAVHQTRPDVKVLGCAGCNYYYSNSWVSRAFAAGLMSFIDGISLHPYNGAQPPEVDSLYMNHGTWEDSQTHLWSVFQSFNTTNKPMELDFTEMGYSSVAPSSTCASCTPDEGTQAAYLSRLMLQSQDLHAKGIPLNAAIWYDFKDDHDPALDMTPNVQHNFGLYNFDLGSYKPAFTAYRNIINGFPDSSDIVTAPPGVRASVNINASAVSTRVWQRKSDRAIIVPFWRLDQVKSVTADFSAYLTVTVPTGMTVGSLTVQQACGPSYKPPYTANGSAVMFQASFNKCASWVAILPAAQAAIASTASRRRRG